MIKLVDLLNEEKETHSYGCVMLYFDFPQMNKIHDAINPDDVYNEDGSDSSYSPFGLEDEPHCTLLYGLHDGVTTEEIKDVLDKYTYSTVKAYNASLFENPNYDVLKFDIKGDNMNETNADLKKYPFTSDYPDYHPHMTVAYLKTGTGKRYVKMLKDVEFDLAPQYAVYSKPNGDKDKIAVKVD